LPYVVSYFIFDPFLLGFSTFTLNLSLVVGGGRWWWVVAGGGCWWYVVDKYFTGIV